VRRPFVVPFVLAGGLAIAAVIVSTTTVSTSRPEARLIASTKTGGVGITNSPSGAILTVATPPGMRPGQVVGPNSVTITNTSSTDATVTLGESNVVNATTGTGTTCGTAPATSAKLGDYLLLTAQDNNGTYLYGNASAGARFDGLTNVAAPGNHPHGNWAPGEAHTYKFTVLFPQGSSTAVNPYQGRCASVGFVWTATQVTS